MTDGSGKNERYPVGPIMASNDRAEPKCVVVELTPSSLRGDYSARAEGLPPDAVEAIAEAASRHRCAPEWFWHVKRTRSMPGLALVFPTSSTTTLEVPPP